MDRILTYTITKDADGWSILRFLKEIHCSHSVITRLKKTECGILVNGEWVHVTHLLKAGDTLVLKLTEPESAVQSILPCSLPVSIVYEDADLLVVNKPSGMPVHPSLGHFENTLANAAAYHAQQKHESYPFRCISRLDRDTSGLTVIAKHAYSSCILNEQMRERKIQRIYYAIAEGKTDTEGTIYAPIARKKDTIIERTVDFLSGEAAITHYQRLAYKDGLSFLRLYLETGRTHQIRVHMQYTGHPLIGDFLYNPKDTRMKRQALHAGNLKFVHPVREELLQFTAPLPEDMLQFFPMIIS